jgi:hypothetical protein
VELCRRTGNFQHQAIGLSYLAHLTALEGNFSQALNILAPVKGYSEETISEKVQYLGVHALIHLWQGDLDIATQTIADMVKMIAPTPPTVHYLLDAYSAWAEVYLTAWEQAQDKRFRDLSRQGCKGMHTFANGERRRNWHSLVSVLPFEIVPTLNASTIRCSR